MTATVTLELPENVLIQALRHLPPARRQELLRRVEDEAWAVQATELKKGPEASQAAAPGTTRARRSTLERAIGLLATGHTAPSDAEIEQLLNERRRERYG